jgi:peptide chain release factor 2
MLLIKYNGYFRMDIYEYSELIKKLTIKIENIKNIVNPNEIIQNLENITFLQQEPNFWDDAKKASLVSQEKTKKERILEKYNKAYNSVVDASDFLNWLKLKMMKRL